MNKKILMFSLLGIIGIGLVSAISYYAVFSATFTINPSIVITGNQEQNLGQVYSGEVIYGDSLTLTNNAPSNREIKIENDADSEVEVSYESELILTQKVVNFSSNKWNNLNGGLTATIRYTLVGNSFNAEVINGSLDNYLLVYYKDNSDRFNSPAKAINVTNINSNLPYENDKNKDEYNYCDTNEYVTCHGAKIWYIPSTAIDSEGNIDWSQASSFLFETELIQYNSEGNLILYPSQELKIIPVYKISNNASGEKTITTQII